jgi:hypothetical protein
MTRKPRKTKTEKQAELAAAAEQAFNALPDEGKAVIQSMTLDELDTVMGELSQLSDDELREVAETKLPGEDNIWPDLSDFPPDKGPVPEDGAEAYRLGFSAADCPFSSETEGDEEYDKFIEWNADWDAAADEAEPEPVGSVVKEEYRARYAEMGHPTHCGDWLAEFLNDQCIVGEGKETDLARFEAICNANGVSLAKYNRTTNGWQGRLRMTGRNLLKAVVVRTGFILVPNIDGLNDRYDADPEWRAAKMPKKGTNEDQTAAAEGV